MMAYMTRHGPVPENVRVYDFPLGGHGGGGTVPWHQCVGPLSVALEEWVAIRKLKGRPVTVVVTLNGLKPGDPSGMEPAVQALRELGDVAAEAGVRISAYNHVDCWNESVPLNVELVKKVNHPQVGFNFNVCHWLKVEGNKDYRPLLRANADKLFCVTICGAQIGAKTWTNGLIQPLDRGDFDNRALLTTLREIGYHGPVGVMCYGIPGDAHDYLQRSMKTWKTWMANRLSRLVLLGMGAVLWGATVARAADRQRVLFEDEFAGKLRDGWSWVYEDPPNWRVAGGKF
jgi:sugar phosphate isomerase/epimerase